MIDPTPRARRGTAFGPVVLATSALLIACAAQVPSPAPEMPSAVGERPGVAVPAKVEVTFIDLPSFDQDVERALRSGASEVEIRLAAPMSPNSIAPRLAKWLATVQESGGKVSVQSDVRIRSLGLITELLGRAVEAWRDARMRSLVSDVDAEIVLRAREIDSVRLRRKADAL